MSGVGSLFVAVGGWNRGDLSVSEVYSIAQEKWKALPQLNTARSSPGSCLLSSLRIYCFSGQQNCSTFVGSIETLHIHTDTKWKTLSFDERVANAYLLVGVSYEGKVLLFGGRFLSGHNMQSFSEEGEFVEDLSEDPLVPGYMTQGSVVVKRGRILASGYRKVRNVARTVVGEFSGEKWSLLSEA